MNSGRLNVAAQALGVQLHLVEVRGSDDFEIGVSCGQ